MFFFFKLLLYTDWKKEKERNMFLNQLDSFDHADAAE